MSSLLVTKTRSPIAASMRIEAADPVRRERPSRFCAQPPFALDQLREFAPERLRYKGTRSVPCENGPSADTYRKAALLGAVARAEALPDLPIPDWARFGYASDTPVYFGHYWWTGSPAPLADHVACVDYSAGFGGPLVAYRWDGVSVLQARNFVSE